MSSRSARGLLGWLWLACGLGAGLAGASTACAESPHVLYMLQCQGCHLADGSGLPGSVPSLSGTMARFLSVEGGRAYLVQVPGSASSPLTDAQLADVLNWMLTRFGPAADAHVAPPYTEAEVASLRATPLVEVEAVRRELLARIGP